ncbi:MAG: hypothetical protein F6K41_10215 [Symploca sp. SIO3E6]|nr:hypothetical protein [Caldora sp. SIO3E6]
MLLEILSLGLWATEGERKKGWGAEGAEGAVSAAERSSEAEGEEITYNFWTQSSRNPTQNFVHP